MFMYIQVRGDRGCLFLDVNCEEKHLFSKTVNITDHQSIDQLTSLLNPAFLDNVLVAHSGFALTVSPVLRPRGVGGVSSPDLAVSSSDTHLLSSLCLCVCCLSPSFPQLPWLSLFLLLSSHYLLSTPVFLSLFVFTPLIVSLTLPLFHSCSPRLPSLSLKALQR